MDQIRQSLTNLGAEYPITVTGSGAKELQFSVAGVPGEFEILLIGGDCVIGRDGWHEHVGDGDGLSNFLRLLFSGEIKIEVTYRGERPVAHRVWRTKDAKEASVTWTGALLSPFWRKKTRRIVEYIPAN